MPPHDDMSQDVPRETKPTYDGKQSTFRRVFSNILLTITLIGVAVVLAWAGYMLTHPTGIQINSPKVTDSSVAPSDQTTFVPQLPLLVP